MPKMVSEIPAGREFQFSAQPGELAVTTNRVFRIIRNTPDEFVDLPAACNIRVGDPHPSPGLSLLRCTNYQAQVEGEGRMVILATFTYEIQNPYGGEDGGSGGGGGGGRLSRNPEIRLANWSVSSSMMEVPAYSWQVVNGLDKGVGSVVAAVNPMGDIYDGVTRLEPVVTITVEQFEVFDPTKHVLHVGKTNSRSIKIGSLDCPRRTVMLRSVQSRAASEQYGALLYRGWDVSYEFAFRRNKVGGLTIAGVHDQELDVGWDIAVPQTGLNVKNTYFPSVANANSSDVEAGSLVLEHEDYKIKGWPSTIGPAEGTGGEKVRGMVLVHEYAAGGASQTPCAQPIPLNDDGTPRWNEADPKVIIKAYKVTDEIDFAATLKLRLI